MGMPSSVKRALHPDAEAALEHFVWPRLRAYLEMTRAAPRVFKKPNGPGYVYPDGSVMSDLTVFWALFNDVYEVLKATRTCRSALIGSNHCLESYFKGLLENGEYWESRESRGVKTLVRVDELTSRHYTRFWRTLRNGHAHVNWHYDDLSALAYWEQLGWATNEPPGSQFRIAARPARNYTIYVADALDWDPKSLWELNDLRIAVIAVADFRWYLHRFLLYLLAGSHEPLF